MQKLYTETQIRALERAAVKSGISTTELMRRAGTAAFQWLKKRWPHAYSLVVFCGGGNNGGDGYVVAMLAKEAGLSVCVRFVGKTKKLKNEAQEAFRICEQAGVEIKPFDAQENFEADLFVDALLGIGLKESVREPIAQVINFINQQKTEVLAIDMPSGLQADTGFGETIVRAKCTVTFIGIKRGLTTDVGLHCAGEVICQNLNLPTELFEQVKSAASILDWQAELKNLKPRTRHTYKGQLGHVLVIGGDQGMSGAPRLAALGALRVGAGLVTVATHPDHAAFVNITQPEIMTHGVATPEDLLPCLEKATVIVIGPGLGQSKWGQALFSVILKFDLPVIVDADALNLLAQRNKRTTKKDNWILTPHPGEAARLLNVKSILQNRFEAAEKIQQKYHGVCVLKGAGTIVMDETIKVCSLGNPGMASGGMGDLLSGVIAGLVAQGMTLSQAAAAAVGLHAKAGDLAAQEGARGLLTTDLLPFIWHLVNEG